MDIKTYEYKDLFHIVEIKNPNYELTLTNHGAGIIDLKTPNNEGKMESIALGFKNLDDFYKDDDYYFGKTIGRFAGRIENGKFTLNGKEYTLEINDKSLNSNLHSGSNPIALKNFDFEIKDNPTSIVYTIQEDKSEFIVPAKYTIIYTLYDNYFTIENIMTADDDTICNMTNHVYFNLSGDFINNILGHKVQMDCLIYKSGNELLPVNEVFDFRKNMSLGKHINDTTLESTKGYDHYFKFNNEKSVKVIDPTSKRYLKVSGNSNGVVIYTGGYFHGKHSQTNHEYKKHDGFTLEFQNMPNGINTNYIDEQSILKENETFHQIIKYEFGLID